MKKLLKASRKGGFTLIEILVVIGIIAILAAVVLIAINPARQFAQARDAQRTSNLNSILNAIGQRISDNKGKFEGSFIVGTVTYYCGKLPTATLSILSDSETATTTTESNKLGCLAPTYIPAFPTDPSGATGSDTGYGIYQDSIGRVHIIASSTEPSISRTVPIEIVR